MELYGSGTYTSIVAPPTTPEITQGDEHTFMPLRDAADEIEESTVCLRCSAHEQSDGLLLHPSVREWCGNR